MWPWIALVCAVAAIAGVAVQRRRAARDRLYAELARQRGDIVARHAFEIVSPVDRHDLAREFEGERLVRAPEFLAPDDVARLRAEALANLPRYERSFIPTHKKGSTLSYEAIHRHAPACLSFYHSPAVQEWVSGVVGQRVVPTPDQDQSSLSILCYRDPGDHINWHYDHNFYRGRHFTVLLSLVNEGPAGLSQSRLERKSSRGVVEAVDTAPGTLVVFEGARVLHRASPLGPDELRLILSMTYCTDPRNNWWKETFRRVKDTAFFGLRALWD